MKYCSDCKHYRPDLTYEVERDRAYLSRCALTGEGSSNGADAMVHPLFSNVRVRMEFCSAERLGERCGPDAKLFEAKEETNGS